MNEKSTDEPPPLKPPHRSHALLGVRVEATLTSDTLKNAEQMSPGLQPRLEMHRSYACVRVGVT